MKYFLSKNTVAVPVIAALLSTTACIKQEELDKIVDGEKKEDSSTTNPGTGNGDGGGSGTGSDSDYVFDNVKQYPDLSEDASFSKLQARGIGGGGAMSGFSISPFIKLRFVGTDMGTLFRSVDDGESWHPINHLQTTFSSDLTAAVGVGFSADPMVVFHAPAGRAPVRSTDAGIKWTKIANFALASGEKIKYWRPHSYNGNIIFAATTSGLWKTEDKGLNWKKLSSTVDGESVGTFIDYRKNGYDIYHANANGIFKSEDGGANFTKVFTPKNLKIRGFTAGRDKQKISFAFMDNDGRNACSDVAKYLNDWGSTSLENHYAKCGYVWTGDSKYAFTRTEQKAGDHIRMSENDSNTIYATGSTAWIRGYGTKIWKSTDTGKNWDLKLNQLDWDVVPFADWGHDRIEYSGVALDVGWHDGGYESFDLNLRDSEQVGGTGYYFLHTSSDGGEYWDAPFTKYAGTKSIPTKGDVWKSTGLEVTTVYRFKFHPNNPKVGYAAMADIGGIITEDGGLTYRNTKIGYNSNYDYAFDPNNDNVVFGVSGSQHDFPMNWHANAAENDEGGVYKSTNRGRSWTRLTPTTNNMNRQFLSLGYDYRSNTLYAGSHGSGIARSTDGGASWAYFNTGLPSGALIIPQIEIDPANGAAYALVTGNAPAFSNNAQTGIYYLAPGGSSWTLLRGTVQRPAEVSSQYGLWYYPTGFAVDFSNGSNRNTLYLVDYENNKNWLATGVWKSTDRGNTWQRQQQFTHPLSVTLDQEDPNRVYVNGLKTLDGSWGEGGLLYTNNGGAKWNRNLEIPFQANARTATIDPNNRDMIFYGFFGSALLYTERP